MHNRHAEFLNLDLLTKLQFNNDCPILQQLL